MSGAFTEDPRLPPPNPVWLDRYEESTAQLMRERAERIANSPTSTEGPEAWERVEELVDLVHLERVQRIIERKLRES